MDSPATMGLRYERMRVPPSGSRVSLINVRAKTDCLVSLVRSLAKLSARHINGTCLNGLNAAFRVDIRSRRA
jgi:hypothetical protein